MVTRDDVARQAGVSPSTVSYVINNGPRSVSQATKDRVFQAIQELGYRPNAVARNLRRQRTSSLGLIIPDIINPYFAQVAQGIEAVAFERDFTVVFCHTKYSLEQELKYLDHLYEERAAGVLWVPATGDVAPAQRLLEYGLPTVVMDRVLDGIELPAVVADNYRGGYLATEHLLSLGHRRIGCIARPVRLSHSQERVAGYQAALEDAGVQPDERLVAAGGYRLENGYEAIQYLLNLDDPPTAVFTYNDIMAIGAIRALKERGLDVPHDFSVVGYDDIPDAAYTCPALTTVRQAKFDMGAKGIELLFKIMDGEDVNPKTEERVAVELVVRETTGPAPN
jgi:LacI family transcriptional regulator